MKLSNRLVTFFLKAWVSTIRVETEFFSEPQFPFIVAFWHGRMFLLPFLFKSYAPQVSILISRHRDGELVSQIVESLGFSTVRGSTGKGKGGEAAFKKMVALLNSGKGVAITPDGPKGPRERVKLGIAKLSIKTGVPIYPISFSAYPAKFLSSWDRFLLPHPFSRAKAVVGIPINPSGFRDEKELAEKLELELNRLTEYCDREMGWKE